MHHTSFIPCNLAMAPWMVFGAVPGCSSFEQECGTQLALAQFCSLILTRCFYEKDNNPKSIPKAIPKTIPETLPTPSHPKTMLCQVWEGFLCQLYSQPPETTGGADEQVVFVIEDEKIMRIMSFQPLVLI